MYKLLKTQHNYLKKQISAIINWEITKKIKRNQVIYEIISIIICEKNIYNILLTRQNTQSFLYSKKMTKNDYV